MVGKYEQRWTNIYKCGQKFTKVDKNIDKVRKMLTKAQEKKHKMTKKEKVDTNEKMSNKMTKDLSFFKLLIVLWTNVLLEKETGQFSLVDEASLSDLTLNTLFFEA